MNVSIVIPVYNEAERLDACLAAIAVQTVRPYEVIVVDNNSTDDTVRIARSFPFVTLLREAKQGVVYARTRGFNEARGEIIGRIDADTILDSGWVANIQERFADESLDAVSGAVTYHDLPWRKFLGHLDLAFRQWIANGMGREVFLYGSNMAIRRTAWEKVRSHLCSSGGMHEDFDLAIHLHEVGCNVTFDRSLWAAVSLRRFNTHVNDYWEYVWLSPKTYSMHGRHSQRRMYPVVLLVVSLYGVIQLLYRCYNPRNGSVSLGNVWLPRAPLRVNPATFVD